MLSLSRTIAENKNAYYKAFMEAEDKLNCGELTLFVNTILGFIRKAQDELIDELEVRVDQLDQGAGRSATSSNGSTACPRRRSRYYTA